MMVQGVILMASETFWGRLLMTDVLVGSVTPRLLTRATGLGETVGS